MPRSLGELTIEGNRYRVVENLGNRNGYWVKMVVPAGYKEDENRRAVVSRRRDQGWRFWTPKDRVGG